MSLPPETLSTPDLPAPAAAADPSYADDPLTHPTAAWRDCLALAKPRVNFMVLITTGVGFYLGAAISRDWTWLSLSLALVGTALLASSSAILNQYLERDHDSHMPRTRRRPLPAKRAHAAEAIALGILMGLIGTNLLAAFVNPLTALLGAFTWASYLFIYTPLKRKSTWNTIVGAVPGAIPPVMGYTAATNSLDLNAAALFGILFFWQLPHFQAIATLYRFDYRAGGYQMLPCVEPGPFPRTARSVALHTVGMLAVSLLPIYTHIVHHWYLAFAIPLGAWFTHLAIRFHHQLTTKPPEDPDLRKSARKLFLASIIYLPLILIALVVARR
jgi:protoheme IX farnesyltransferase